MAFPESIVKQAFQRANGHCECNRHNCGHHGRCNKPLLWSERGNDKSKYGWEAHHIVSQKAGGPDTLSNCEIVCIECHKNTRSYGR